MKGEGGQAERQCPDCDNCIAAKLTDGQDDSAGMTWFMGRGIRPCTFAALR